MIYIYAVLALVLIYFSYKSFRGGLNYLAYFRSKVAGIPSAYSPFCSIIAPCKGLDTDLRQNLECLFQQNFASYEVVFVVESDVDPAVSVINPLISEKASEQCRAKLVIAGVSTDEAQKVHNLRFAVTQVTEQTEVFVFVDSDARPDPQWLRHLVAPLENEDTGCASGYRWFFGKTNGFATELRAAWNASIASQLGENTSSNFCWGGSTAIRRDVFERLLISEKWHGVLSDDFAMTNAVRQAELKIVHVPQCLTPTVEDCSFAEMIEFTTRQMKITRVYSTKLWVLSFVSSGLFNLVMLWSFLLLFSTSFRLYAAGVILVVSAFSIGKNILRIRAVELVMPERIRQLRRQLFIQNLLWIMTPLIFFLNCFAALLSREIVWRGIHYRMVSAHQTEIIRSGEK